MWVAQVTERLEPGQDSDINELYQELQDSFGDHYQLSIMVGSAGQFVICRPREDTILAPGDEGTEREILQFIVTELLRAVIDSRREVVEAKGFPNTPEAHIKRAITLYFASEPSSTPHEVYQHLMRELESFAT